MAVTKRQIADLIISIKSGGEESSNSKFDEREVWFITDMVVNNLIAAEVEENKRLSGTFIIPFPEVKVDYDKSRAEYFSVLPARPISLQDDKGVMQVSPMEDQRNIYIKRRQGALATYSPLESGNMLGKTSYYPEGSKIFYIGMPKIMDGKEVLIKMVASLEGIDEDSPLPIPASKEIQLYQLVSQILMEQKETPQDKTTDANPNTK